MKLRFRHIAAILALALLGWALCGAVMFAGMSLFSMDTALVVHAIAAPIIFCAISWFYFSRLGYTTPATTAVVFTLTVVLMDFFLVALIINRNLDMFRSLLGTWIPFGLIFLSTYLTGLAVKPKRRQPKPI
jgi:hypothetical protein